MALDPDGFECLRLFSELDGCDLAVAGHRWRVLVFSVSMQDGALWVQVELQGDCPARLRVLRLAPGEGVRQALRELMGWLTSPVIEGVVQVS